MEVVNKINKLKINNKILLSTSLVIFAMLFILVFFKVIMIKSMNLDYKDITINEYYPSVIKNHRIIRGKIRNIIEYNSLSIESKDEFNAWLVTTKLLWHPPWRAVGIFNYEVTLKYDNCLQSFYFTDNTIIYEDEFSNRYMLLWITDSDLCILKKIVERSLNEKK